MALLPLKYQNKHKGILFYVHTHTYACALSLSLSIANFLLTFNIPINCCGMLVVIAQRVNHANFYNKYLLLLEEYTDRQTVKVCNNR